MSEEKQPPVDMWVPPQSPLDLMFSPYIDKLLYPNLRRHLAGWPFVGIGIGRILFQIPYDRLNDDEVWWHEFLECAIEDAIKHEKNYKEKVVLGRGKIGPGETTVPHFVASLLTNSSMVFNNVLRNFEPDGFAELVFGDA